MTTEQIIEKLESAGCEVREQNGKIFVNSTPCGHAGRYGYCVAGDDVRDITDHITKRQGEIRAILSK